MKFSIAVFKDQNSSRLFVGQFISQICDKMMTLGLVWVISQEQSIQMIPWFLAVGALPHLLLASSGGKLVQRIGVLRTLIHTDVLRGIIFLLVGLLWLAYFKHHSLATLFILTFVSNLLGALFNIAVFTLPGLMPKKELVPQLTAMVDSCFSLGTVVGPAISALLYPWLGLSGLLVLNGLSYLLAAGLEGGIRLDPADPETVESAPANADMAPAIPGRSMFADPLIRFMLSAFFLMNLALTPLMALLPLFVQTRFAGNLAMLAAFEVSIGMGMVAGSLLLSVAEFPLNRGKRAIAGLSAVSLLYLFFGLNHNPVLACLALAGLGLALAVVNVSLLTLFQSRPAPADVPVVMSWVNTISIGALPISMLIVGSLIEKIDLTKMTICLALGLLTISLATAFYREFREI